MRFEAALVQMREGRLVKLPYWGPEVYIHIKHNTIRLGWKDKAYDVPADISCTEILREDWCVFEFQPMRIVGQ